MRERLPRIVIVVIIVLVVVIAFLRPADSIARTDSAASRGAGEWVSGYAELSRFRVVHERYGEPREGDIVLVFVREDFLPGQQVKFEGRPADEEPVSVLKLNELRRFTTGIADYALMRTVFTPVATGEALKVTASVQDWCGQTWAQLNRVDGAWRARGYSYFQAEGDTDERLPDAATEDGLWTQLRLDPGALPLGAVEMIPGLFHHRLHHGPLGPIPAEATLAPARDGVQTYRVAYSDARTLEIDYRSAAPHAIEAFRELRNGRIVVDAVRTHTVETDYWNDLSRSDESLREALGLEP